MTACRSWGCRASGGLLPLAWWLLGGRMLRCRCRADCAADMFLAALPLRRSCSCVRRLSRRCRCRFRPRLHYHLAHRFLPAVTRPMAGWLHVSCLFGTVSRLLGLTSLAASGLFWLRGRSWLCRELLRRPAITLASGLASWLCWNQVHSRGAVRRRLPADGLCGRLDVGSCSGTAGAAAAVRAISVTAASAAAAACIL